MSESVHDHEEKLRPTINYLQKLSAQYLPQIFDASRWVLDIDSDLGFEASHFVWLLCPFTYCC